MDDKLKERIEELVREKIAVVPYNPAWPKLFEDEAAFLRRKLPQNIVKRIEHFGSTAVPGLSAKPIIDILAEVSSLEETKKQIVPILEAEGYEYFWRPAFGDDGPPFYAWFIKRNSEGQRTHHIHMVEADSELWDRLYFRDYLLQFPTEAKCYDELKRKLSEEYPIDRVKYTEGKSGFILSVTKKAKEYYESQN
ncbi:dephospho-CoA kinase/protein folding accessory domain-containing protein [bacterium BMS3Abin05]|nr:dephospho-CoA kinase/protein folding accessory domain-containing protein [bacterium BMS3Abin05]